LYPVSPHSPVLKITVFQSVLVKLALNEAFRAYPAPEDKARNAFVSGKPRLDHERIIG
jgi:hypothetical protein